MGCDWFKIGPLISCPLSADDESVVAFVLAVLIYGLDLSWPTGGLNSNEGRFNEPLPTGFRAVCNRFIE